MVGHSGLHIDIKIKFLMAQLMFKKQIKIFTLLAIKEFTENKTIATIAKKVCGFI